MNKQDKFITIGIILAAGSSKRMGAENKLLCPLNENTILEQSLNSFALSKVDKIILVVGYGARNITALPLVKQLKAQNKLSIVTNENFQQGMGTSLACGVKELDANSHACLIGLGDMPFISHQTINKIIDAARGNNEKAIFAPEIGGKMGHPILWKKQFFKPLSQLNQDQGAKGIIAQNKTLLELITVNDKGILQDIDTPEMLPKIVKSHRK
jgi:molybdenum cofactor cytidylyltransferase